jgi:hypothetical protein
MKSVLTIFGVGLLFVALVFGVISLLIFALFTNYIVVFQNVCLGLILGSFCFFVSLIVLCGLSNFDNKLGKWAAALCVTFKGTI